MSIILTAWRLTAASIGVFLSFVDEQVVSHFEKWIHTIKSLKNANTAKIVGFLSVVLKELVATVQPKNAKKQALSYIWARIDKFYMSGIYYNYYSYYIYQARLKHISIL